MTETSLQADTLLWWESDEVNLVAVYLDGRSLGSFAICCRAVHANLRSVSTLRWVASLRGLDSSSGISSVEHIELAEVMATCTSSIFFGWGSMDVDQSANASLRSLARALDRHQSLHLSIEAHCGLEARYAMPLPGQAREFTRCRAEAVRQALVNEAMEAGVPLNEGRILTKAWGCSRPLVWCFGQKGMAEPYDPDGAAKNRRVELFLRGDGFEVPCRRLRSQVPRPPGELKLDDWPNGAPDDNDDDGTASAGTMDSDLAVPLQLANGEEVRLPAAMLNHLIHYMTTAGGMGSESDEEDDHDTDSDGN
mmetsp:Transcript_33951/g.56143  ORF Transcript_33951/g.56143 Transcript_33951/m.56143 type:complete len:308 (+) Transcript_33951:94-1017(+)|eukprot:CAMPEP_0119338412 /NCGR_PEP_ID=MMETSP1333-20130426/95965_1 /TAXON_ID=418940 /ORGANISM="Scyphosphaera apsteinii, Strain RCC1455" /LENGTH=307 /DNA_ID=CAMNT_0007349673 /DNA_START=92 /DNA_END=1015 /DNA_ORIENTATION=+